MQDELSKRYAAKAVLLLRRAKAGERFNGPGNLKNLKGDKDMAALLATPEGKQLVAELESTMRTRGK